MAKVLLGCGVVALIGVALFVAAPRIAGIGLALIVIPAVVAAQALLLGLVRRFPKAGDTECEYAVVPSDHKSELAAVLLAHNNFKLFLARVAGYVGLLFGIVTSNIYYIGLSAALIVLFGTLDRMDASRRAQTESMSTDDQ
jgi:hypothetical protein